MKALYDTLEEKVKPYPRADDEPVVGLDPRYLVLTVIQEAPPQTATGEGLTATEAIDLEALTLTRGYSITPAPPLVVSMRALRFALEQAGLYSSVKAAASATNEGEIWWQSSTTVRRDHPFVSQLGGALNQSAEQIDALFSAAKNIDAAL